MGFEPNARRRLQLLWATTTDSSLRRDLGIALEDQGMAFVPSADLLRQIASCPTCEPSEARRSRDGLCETHRARWNLELCTADSAVQDGAEVLDGIMKQVLGSERSGRELISALDRQLRALNLVWEAHERGAVRLPDRIAETVNQARLNVPACLPSSSTSAPSLQGSLPGGATPPRSRVQQAS